MHLPHARFGLAYVPIEMTPVGTCFEVEIREHAFPAEAVKTPFVSKKTPAVTQKS